MADENAIQKICRIALKGLGYVSFLAPLLTRLVIGYIFYGTGHGKLAHLDKITGYFENLGIPFPHLNAVFIGTLEYVGGICLIIGLLTRPVSALLGATMIVALMTGAKDSFIDAWHGADADGNEKSLLDVSAFVMGMLLLWLMMYGPGLLSIDALIRKWIGVDKKEAPAPVQA
jgi:putative oxidoreductase